MSSENLLELISLASRCLAELEAQNSTLQQIAQSLDRGVRSPSQKQHTLDQKISLMMAHVEYTGETTKKGLAAHFNMDPSAIRGDKYEAVKEALALNRAAARARRTMNAHTDNFTNEVLDE